MQPVAVVTSLGILNYAKQLLTFRVRGVGCRGSGIGFQISVFKGTYTVKLHADVPMFLHHENLHTLNCEPQWVYRRVLKPRARTRRPEWVVNLAERGCAHDHILL